MLVAPDAQKQLDPADPVALENWRETHPGQPSSLPQPQATAEGLLLKCRACAKAERWAEVEQIASSATATYPNEPAFFAQWAWAAYRQDRTVEAYEIVTKVADHFPHSVAIAYAVACLNGALRRTASAKRWLALAIERARNPDKVKLRSLIQPELQCVWNEGLPQKGNSGETIVVSPESLF